MSETRPHHYMNADGFCHAGDAFEAGTDFIALYTAEDMAEVWDEGARAATADYGIGEAVNPYRKADR